MKILQVIPYFGLGGAEIMCENLVEALIDASNDVTVISLYSTKTPITERLEKRGVKIIYLDKRVGLDFSIAKKMLKIINEEKPDVIHTHLASLKYAYSAVKKSKIKIPIVHTVHSIAQKESPLRDRIFNRFWYKNGKVIPVALSKEIQKTVLQVYGLDEQDVPIVFNGLNFSKCIQKQAYSSDEKIKLLHIGRFTAEKNHQCIIDAVRLLTDSGVNVSLKLIGEGPLKAEIEQNVRELGLDSVVEFMGAQSNVYPFLSDADVFMLPSIYEGIPLSLVEAIGTGLPIVASNVGGIPDMIENEVNGLIITPDAESLASAIKRLVESEELREKLGKNALSESDRFSAKNMAKKYLEIYDTLALHKLLF